jgi:hypothetical protein
LRLVLWKRHLVSPLLARHVRIVDRPTRISTARSKPANALGCGRPFGTQWCVAPVPFEFCFSSLQLSSPVVPICFDSNCSLIIRLSESDVGTYVYTGVGMSTCVARLLECDAATFALTRVGLSTVDRTFAHNLKPYLIYVVVRSLKVSGSIMVNLWYTCSKYMVHLLFLLCVSRWHQYSMLCSHCFWQRTSVKQVGRYWSIA